MGCPIFLTYWGAICTWRGDPKGPKISKQLWLNGILCTCTWVTEGALVERRANCLDFGSTLQSGTDSHC